VTVPLPRPTFGALRHRNFRLFLTGQFVSLTGTWMQTVAQGWLVLKLTESAFQVGLVTALGTLPVLLFTLYGGVIADRVNKRRFILALQACMLIQAWHWPSLTATGRVTVVWVMALASLLGILQRVRDSGAAGLPLGDGRPGRPDERHRAQLQRVQRPG
jgi:MFS family permease